MDHGRVPIEKTRLREHILSVAHMRVSLFLFVWVLADFAACLTAAVLQQWLISALGRSVSVGPPSNRSKAPNGVSNKRVPACIKGQSRM